MSAIHEIEPTVLALHGFTLAGAMFDELAALVDLPVVAPDLPGHGGRGGANTSWAAAVEEVAVLAAENQPVIGLGYSMGGRVALAAALDQPQLFTGLVLASTSLGIAGDAARESRLKADKELAGRLQAVGIAAWDLATELGSSPELDAIRRRNDQHGMAAALRGMGQGAQPYLGDRLDEFAGPTIWLAGGRDPKYVAIAQAAAAAGSRARFEVIDGARHNLILDAPQRVAGVVNRLAAEWKSSRKALD